MPNFITKFYVPPSGGLKEGYGGKIQRFSSFKRQYLENGNSRPKLLIESRM